MSIEVQPQPQPFTPPAPRWSKRKAVLIGMVVVIGGGLFVIGTLPRLRQKAALAADVKQIRTAIPALSKFTPETTNNVWCSDNGEILTQISILFV